MGRRRDVLLFPRFAHGRCRVGGPVPRIFGTFGRPPVGPGPPSRTIPPQPSVLLIDFAGRQFGLRAECGGCNRFFTEI